ncbi:MAG TPA: NAD(P)/FAD-dependent oxidoreductase [Chloroflexota bacterium]|jgi:phytoene dehydrogenase-like protein
MTANTCAPTRTLVVGGGVAGLATATYLARGGMRVSVLEKTDALGGRAITDTVDGFALNRGVHALYTGGPASSVLSELDIRYSHGSPRRVLARDASGLHPYPASLSDLLRTDLLSAADKRELFAVLVRLSVLKPERLAHQSVQDWVAATARRPMVRRLLTRTAQVYLYTTATDLASADAFVERFQQTLKHPIHYIDGGWQTLVEGLRDVATAAGVEILPSASVDHLLVRDGAAHAVRLHDGREFPADVVVIATTPEDALRVLPDGAAPDLEREVAATLPVHVACLDLALSTLPAPEHPVVFDFEQPRFFTVQSEYARIAPSGGAVLHAFMQFDARQPSDAHQARADLEAFVEVAQPGWQAHAVERRYLPHILASGALPLASRGGLAGRMAHRSQDISNVFFAGDWVGPHGYLVDASLGSARESARQILRAEAVQPAQRAA